MPACSGNFLRVSEVRNINKKSEEWMHANGNDA